MTEQKNRLEWIVFSFSLLLIISLIIFLAYLSFTHEKSDPKLEVTFRQDEQQKDKFIYFVTLSNNGNSTAEDVKVELIAWKQGKEEEKGELDFLFSPRNSKREGWVSFKNDPTQMDSVTARVSGYVKP